MPNHTSLQIAGALTVVMATAITGCSGPDHQDTIPKDYGTDWLDQSSAMFPDAVTGGGGPVNMSSDSTTARAVVQLDTDLAGPYDVVAMCRSSETVHLGIHAFTTKTDRNGHSADLGALLGEADLTCGTQARIPTDVPKGSQGIELDASTGDTSGRALWDAVVLAPGTGS